MFTTLGLKCPGCLRRYHYTKNLPIKYAKRFKIYTENKTVLKINM